MICERCDEGIRGVCIVQHSTTINANSPIRHGTVMVAVGDLMIKLCVSLHDKACFNLKYQRSHTMNVCANTFVLPHQHSAALITPGDSHSCMVLDAFLQKQFLLSNVELPASGIPFAYDGLNLGWKDTLYNGVTTIFLVSIQTQITTHCLYYSVNKRPAMFVLSGLRLVSVVNATDIQVHNFIDHEEAESVDNYYAVKHKIQENEASYGDTYPKTHQPGGMDLPDVWNEQRSLDVLERDYGYVRKADEKTSSSDAGDIEEGASTQPRPQPRITSHLDEFQRSRNAGRWSDFGYSVDLHRGQHLSVDQELLAISKRLRCVKFTAHKEGRVLAVLAENNGEDIITLGSDRKIKLWHKGQLVCKFVNVQGTFTFNMPVILKRRGRAIYYSSDESIQCVIVPFDIENDQGKLDLARYVM